MVTKNELLKGEKITPRSISSTDSLKELIDNTFLSYNAGRIREACQIFTQKMLKNQVTTGLALSGALTPAGLGKSCLIPLMERGFIDWIVSTGANLYHDIHFALGLSLHKGSHVCNDAALRRVGIVRIYDIYFDYNVLLETDAFLKNLFSKKEFHTEMGSAELHYRIGKYLNNVEEKRGTQGSSILSTAYRLGIPVYVSSPGDSSIGMNCAALSLSGESLKIDVALDVNETAAIVYRAKQQAGKSGVVILGGGSPKNFILQTEPHIQEVLGLNEKGHDYFIQITDARPDTGGLSGATPNEAMSWGKVDPESLPNTVVAYLDTTVALPLLTAYSFTCRKKRAHKRLFDKRKEMMALLKQDYCEKNTKQ
jgi:deoxyhypusine synthase